MLNMIKMELYRLFHTKSAYVIWGILCAFLIFSTYLLRLDRNEIEKYENNPAASSEREEKQAAVQEWEEEQEEMEQSELGISVTSVTKFGEKVTVFDELFSELRAMIVALFMLIFTVLFADADRKSGYIKGIGGQLPHRGFLVVAKTVALLVYTVVTIFGVFLVQCAANGLLFGYLKLGNLQEISIYLGVQTILHFALLMIGMTISLVMRNTVGSVTCVILICINLPTIFYARLDRILSEIADSDIHIENYTVTGKISMLPMKLGRDDVLAAFAVSACFVVVLAAASGIYFQKRDVV